MLARRCFSAQHTAFINDKLTNLAVLPRWFSGIIRPSGFLTQEFTSLSMGEVPRSIRGWGLFAALLPFTQLPELWDRSWSYFWGCRRDVRGWEGENCPGLARCFVPDEASLACIIIWVLETVGSIGMQIDLKLTSDVVWVIKSIDGVCWIHVPNDNTSYLPARLELIQ